MSDVRVAEVQTWLNEAYPEYFYYDEAGINSGKYPVKIDGMTGNTTVTALIRVLQLNLNLTPDGIFGNGTANACPTISPSTTNENLVKVVQGGLICKGYNPGLFDGIYGNDTSDAVKQFKEDLGFANAPGTISGQMLKSLLTTDPTLVTSETDMMIRQVQQYLNLNYSDLYLTALGYIPTYGVYERKTNKALIYAFQDIIGTTADGAIGTNTFNSMPSINVGCTNTELNKILQCALICNGISLSSIDGVYSDSMADKISEFQEFMCLNLDPNVTLGSVNRRTWGALLLSKGDPDRKANALDCVHQVTAAEAEALYAAGYRYIGRYLTKVTGGLNKNLTDEEIANILNAGIHIFPIFQETNSSIDAFTYENGVNDGTKAFVQALAFRFPANTIIYFAVDFDVTEAQTKNQVFNYFTGIQDAASSTATPYKVGIYGSRNTCSIICSLGLAVSSFVSDMSTGYSGNLGFTIPENWAFDQFATVNFTGGGSTFAIDKNMASGRDLGVSLITDIDFWSYHLIDLAMIAEAREKAVNVSEVISIIQELEDTYYEYRNKPDGDVDLALDCCQAVLRYLISYKYVEEGFYLIIPGDTGYEHVVIANTALSNKIEPYIRETFTTEGENTLVHRYTLLKDNLGSLFELPHIAAVLTAYVSPSWVTQLVSKPTWYGWAGDLATALSEMTILVQNYPTSSALDHARDRIGEMEPEVMIKNDGSNTVQFNYCDIYGDSDGVGLRYIIDEYLEENSSGTGKHTHLLSSALSNYYTTEKYKNRHSYLLQDAGITATDVLGIKEGIKALMSSSQYSSLLTQKAGEYNNYPQHQSEVMEGCCQCYAEWLAHELN